MSPHPLKAVIEAADRAITARDFDAVMDFYAEDATLVVRPGLNATGKAAIRRAFEAIDAHFNQSLKVSQGEMVVIEGAETALVVMESILDARGEDGADLSTVRRSTFVFRRDAAGRWLCVIDNSYGTDLIGAG